MTNASKIARNRIGKGAQITRVTVTGTMPTSMTANASTSVVDAQDGAKTVSDDVSPLLGLEQPLIEKAGENPAQPEDSNRVDLLAPLLGTNCHIAVMPDNRRLDGPAVRPAAFVGYVARTL